MHRRKGFTLIELLCVLGTVAILCTISVPVMKQVDARSKDRADEALIMVYNQAMESYRFNDYSMGRNSVMTFSHLCKDTAGKRFGVISLQ